MNKTDIFNSLLIDSIFENEIITNDVDTCLISDEPLTDTNIKLKCGHSFNYDSIFNEIKIRKKNICRYNGTKIKMWSIQCPYCRKIQVGILPYLDGYEKIKYVNWPPKHSFCSSKCSYIFKRGKNKGKECGKRCIKKFCKYHYKYNSKNKENIEISNQIPKLFEKKYVYALCEHTLTRGPNKGNQCNTKVILHKFKKNDSTDNINLNDYRYKRYYCKCHQKKYGNLEKLSNN